jgi:hypothetical protein
MDFGKKAGNCASFPPHKVIERARKVVQVVRKTVLRRHKVVQQARKVVL